jgi:hypothetical protein
MTAVYPNTTFTWRDRVDNVDPVFANDVNSIVDEVIAIEQTAGTNPQQEKQPIIGTTPVNYASIDARISDTLAGSLKPVVELSCSNLPCKSGELIFNSYRARFDPFRMYNGNDVVVPADGWWIISATQQWEQPFGFETGFSTCGLFLNGAFLHHHVWRWDFPNRGLWPFGFPIGTFGTNTMTWQGLLHKGDRFQIGSNNGTFFEPHHIVTGDLKACWIRSANATSFITG